MLMTFAEQTMKIDSWETEREMVYALDHCDAGRILLGGDAEEPRKFCSVIAFLDWPKTSTSRFGIGVRSEDHGVDPQVVVQADTDLLVFGFNNEVVGIKDRCVSFKITLCSSFSSFLALNDKNMLLAFHEIGVVALSRDGRELWRYDQDVVVDWNIRGHSLFLTFMDATPVALNLEKGERSS